MASTTAITLTFKSGLFVAGYKLSTDSVKCALYTSSATNSASTTAYSSTNEITGTGYTAGGNPLSGWSSGTGTSTGGVPTAFFSWSNVSWTSATFAAASLVIYDVTNSNASILVYDFGGTFSVTSGTFTIIFPTNDQNNAIIRLG